MRQPKPRTGLASGRPGHTPSVNQRTDLQDTDAPYDGAGRNETEAERLDRLFADILQELRVMQTGAQLTGGFLLTLPFQGRFADLDAFATVLYLVMVFLAALTTALVLTPVAVHRRLTGQHVKERVVRAGHLFVNAALCCLVLLVSGMVLLIFYVVMGPGWAIAAGGSIAAALVALLGIAPSWLIRVPTDH